MEGHLSHFSLTLAATIRGSPFPEAATVRGTRRIVETECRLALCMCTAKWRRSKTGCFTFVCRGSEARGERRRRQ
jgi:hypothetical protein